MKTIKSSTQSRLTARRRIRGRGHWQLRTGPVQRPRANAVITGVKGHRPAASTFMRLHKWHRNKKMHKLLKEEQDAIARRL